MAFFDFSIFLNEARGVRAIPKAYLFPNTVEMGVKTLGERVFILPGLDMCF